MTSPLPPSIPLLGALLVTEGLLSQDQVEACLLLQQHDYPELRLGEIALRCGYLTTDELAHVLGLQQEHRRALRTALECQMPIPADLDALVIMARPSAALNAALTGMGVRVQYAEGPRDYRTAPPPDLILLDPGQLFSCEGLPDTSLVALLPPELWRWRELHSAPMGVLALLERYVRQARAQRPARRSAVTAAPWAQGVEVGDEIKEAALGAR
jgi:hypothetical protein